MSTTETGKKYVRKAISILEGFGYIIDARFPHRIRSRGRWLNVDEDFFGVFDIEAIGPLGPLDFSIGFIQVTDEAHASVRRKKIESRLNWPTLNGVAYEVWAWNPRRSWFTRYRRAWGPVADKPDLWIKLGTIQDKPETETK